MLRKIFQGWQNLRSNIFLRINIKEIYHNQILIIVYRSLSQNTIFLHRAGYTKKTLKKHLAWIFLTIKMPLKYLFRLQATIATKMDSISTVNHKKFYPRLVKILKYHSVLRKFPRSSQINIKIGIGSSICAPLKGIKFIAVDKRHFHRTLIHLMSLSRMGQIPPK